MTKISIKYDGVRIMDGLKIVNPMTENKKMIVEISPVLLLTFLQRRKETLKHMRDKYIETKSEPSLINWCSEEIQNSHLVELQITKIHQMKVEG